MTLMTQENPSSSCRTRSNSGHPILRSFNLPASSKTGLVLRTSREHSKHCHLAAPDAKTRGRVQLWLWWLPPTAFYNTDDGRAVCKSRQRTIWTTMLSAYNAGEVLELLPDLEPELWEHVREARPATNRTCVDGTQSAGQCTTSLVLAICMMILPWDLFVIK